MKIVKWLALIGGSAIILAILVYLGALILHLMEEERQAKPFRDLAERVIERVEAGDPDVIPYLSYGAVLRRSPEGLAHMDEHFHTFDSGRLQTIWRPIYQVTKTSPHPLIAANPFTVRHYSNDERRAMVAHYMSLSETAAESKDYELAFNTTVGVIDLLDCFACRATYRGEPKSLGIDPGPEILFRAAMYSHWSGAEAPPDFEGPRGARIWAQRYLRVGGDLPYRDEARALMALYPEEGDD